MAVLCPNCHRQYDVTLFQFGQTLTCDCGTLVDPFDAAAVKGRAFGSPLARGLYPRASTAEVDPRAKPGAPAAVDMPIDGVLDLHTFQPGEVKDLVPEYLEACARKGIDRVRIIHGKGTGTLLRTVRSVLKKLPEVASIEPAGEDEGGWGATIVRLRRRAE